jgi:N-acetylglucosaminyl-diphospho-decaprenol L-rhamnosyltransferase
MVQRCLGYLFASRTRYAYKVIVVDNDSADGTADKVAAEFPAVHLIRSGGNLGFAQGNNLGFAHVEGRHVLLLNPDAFLTDATLLDDLVRWLDAHPEFGALGCRITFPDGRHQVGDAGFQPSAAAMACWALGLSRWCRGVFLAGRPQRLRAIDVDWICGAFMLVRRAVLTAVGGFDEGFFMYGEDVEWGCRARARGIRIAYIPWRAIVHVQSGTQYQDGHAVVSTKWLDNLIVLHRRLHPGGCWRCVQAAVTIGLLARAWIYRGLAVLRDRPALRHKAAAMGVFARHVWSMPR